MAELKSRTIDSLGVEPSNRYAKDQALRDLPLINDSKVIRTEVSVITPSIPGEFDAHFTLTRAAPWAIFPPRPEGLEYATLFSYQLIPSWGGTEKQQALIDKVEAMNDSPERTIVLTMLQRIGALDRDLALINNNRNRWQKG